MKRSLLLTMLLGLGLAPAWAQTQENGGKNMPPGENVVGKVTSVGKDSLVLAPLTGGDPVTVKIGENTRISKDRQPIKLGEIKNDDVVFARGDLKNNVMESAMVRVVNAQMLQTMGQGGTGQGRGQGMGAGAGGVTREDLGKKFIAGEVKAINETKLTIARPDSQTQDIEVDENTSFKRGKESITYPDIKVGDFVRGPGELKNGVFVPKELVVGHGQMRIIMEGQGNSPQTSPPADKPSPQAPPKN